MSELHVLQSSRQAVQRGEAPDFVPRVLRAEFWVGKRRKSPASPGSGIQLPHQQGIEGTGEAPTVALIYHFCSHCEAPTYPSPNVAKGQIIKWASCLLLLYQEELPPPPGESVFLFKEISTACHKRI